MSKRYTTDEILDAVDWAMADLDKDMIDDIIRRLRSADRLCEAAKVAMVGLDAHGHKRWADDLDKAIAEYDEGK